jgi:hypothetical protein
VKIADCVAELHENPQMNRRLSEKPRTLSISLIPNPLTGSAAGVSSDELDLDHSPA